METTNHILGVLFVVLLTVVTSYTQPAGRDGFMSDLEYNVPESPRPRNADKYVRNNGLGNLLLKNLRFRDLSRMPWMVNLNSRVPVGAEDSAPTDFTHAKVKSKRTELSMDDLAGMLRLIHQRDTTDDGVKLPVLRFGRK